MAYKCELCDMSCSERRSLKAHYKCKHGRVPESFHQLPTEASTLVPCTYCGSQYSKRHLSDHRKVCPSKPSMLASVPSLSREARHRYRNLMTRSSLSHFATGEDEQELIDKFRQWLVTKGLARKTIQFHTRSMDHWLAFIKEPKWLAEEEMLEKAFTGYRDFLGSLSNENAREDARATHGNFVCYLQENHRLELTADHDTVSQLLAKYFASDKRRTLMDYLSGKEGSRQVPFGFTAKQLRCFVMAEVILATSSTSFVTETTLAEFNGAGKAMELPLAVQAPVQQYVLVYRPEVVGQHHHNKEDIPVFALNHDKVWKVCENGLWDAVQDFASSVTRLNTKRVLKAEYQYPEATNTPA